MKAAVRRPGALPTGAQECSVTGDINGVTEWTEALAGVDCVVHTAAHAHVFSDVAAVDPAFMSVNVDGTAHLADAAARAGVRRFVYLSSIKVNGEETHGRAYTADDEPRPQNLYGISKWRGELALREIELATGMQAVVVRSPLVYGPGVRANFLSLLRWVDREVPLPFGAIANRRSLVSLWNLCDFLVQMVNTPAAAGRTWLVSDGEDVSTPDLIRRLALAMKRRARLVRVPVGVLRAMGALAGRRAAIDRLCGSLAVDITPASQRLGWAPPLSVDEGLQRTADWYAHRTVGHGI